MGWEALNAIAAGAAALATAGAAWAAWRAASAANAAADRARKATGDAIAARAAYEFESALVPLLAAHLVLTRVGVQRPQYNKALSFLLLIETPQISEQTVAMSDLDATLAKSLTEGSAQLRRLRHVIAPLGDPTIIGDPDALALVRVLEGTIPTVRAALQGAWRRARFGEMNNLEAAARMRAGFEP